MVSNKSILFESVAIHHHACIGQSMIGGGSNLAFGFATATRKINGNAVRCHITPSEAFLTSASHHGAVIGAGVQTGAQVTFMPGTSVQPGVLIGPHRTASGWVSSSDLHDSSL